MLNRLLEGALHLPIYRSLPADSSAEPRLEPYPNKFERVDAIDQMESKIPLQFPSRLYVASIYICATLPAAGIYATKYRLYLQPHIRLAGILNWPGRLGILLRNTRSHTLHM